MSAGRMFDAVTSTWNPITGCLHRCEYCWARRLAEGRLKGTKKYKDGFEPKFHPQELKRRFKPGELVFVSDVGDAWGEWVPREWIEAVLNHVRRFPRTHFLFLTKNPRRYHEFLDVMPSNAILGATIETNNDFYYWEWTLSRNSPPPSVRYRAMRDLDWPRKFVSIEPVLAFDLEEFVKWMVEIRPVMIYVGYDNYDNKLPEPPLDKTLELIKELRGRGLDVRPKTIRKAWYER